MYIDICVCVCVFMGRTGNEVRFFSTAAMWCCLVKILHDIIQYNAI